jgi:hypothetical protein
MAYSMLFLLVFAIAFDADQAYAQAVYPMSALEWNTDRLGLDYNVFELQTPDPALCQDACATDRRCMAWTYVQPNTFQGPQARCWLKQALPPPSYNPSCVSGYKLR